MKPDSLSRVAEWALRLSLSSAYLSAVADRFGLWGPPGAANVAWGAWAPFQDYTGTLVFFLPGTLIPAAAWAATLAEVVLGVLLLVGIKLRASALASAGLLLVFALSMTFSGGIKGPLNYSVFTAFAASLALAALAPRKA